MFCYVCGEYIVKALCYVCEEYIAKAQKRTVTRDSENLVPTHRLFNGASGKVTDSTYYL